MALYGSKRWQSKLDRPNGMFHYFVIPSKHMLGANSIHRMDNKSVSTLTNWFNWGTRRLRSPFHRLQKRILTLLGALWRHLGWYRTMYGSKSCRHAGRTLSSAQSTLSRVPTRPSCIFTLPPAPASNRSSSTWTTHRVWRWRLSAQNMLGQ